MSAHKPTRLAAWIVGGLLVLGVGGGAGWAANTLMEPPDDVLSSGKETYTLVAEGEVGSSINLTAIAEWVSTPAGTNRASGVVTSVNITSGDMVSTGTELYAVDLRPVFIAQGQTPAFRAISEGTEGPDVAQLQEMLGSLGFYTSAVDGKAEVGTVRAINAWQKSLGLEQTGTVDIGDVIYVPQLPIRISLDSTSVARDLTVGGGERAVRVLSAAPRFSLTTTASQAQLMPIGTPVEITRPDGAEWFALTDKEVTDPTTDITTMSLIGRADQPICADQCDSIAADGQTKLNSRVIIQQTVSGLVVPSAALVSQASGEIVVIDDAGKKLPVTVVASARGMSVIEGVPAGARVIIPTQDGAQ